MVLEKGKVLAPSIFALMKKLGNDLYILEKVRNERLVSSLMFFITILLHVMINAK